VKALFGTLLLFFGVSIQANEVTLLQCDSSEKVIFQCQVKAKRALLCGSSEYISYRYKYGSSKKIELQLPATIGASPNYFRLASHPTPGGSVSYIHFSNQGYDYYLLDDSSKNVDGSFSPSSKLIVFKGKRIVTNSICENDDSGIQQDAYVNMPKEAFDNNIDIFVKKETNLDTSISNSNVTNNASGTIKDNFEGESRIEYFKYDPSNLFAGVRYFSRSVGGIRRYEIKIRGECDSLQIYKPYKSKNQIILDGSCQGQGSQVHQYVYEWDKRYTDWCLRKEISGERADRTSRSDDQLVSVKVKGCIPLGSGRN
jgi:hypothetical protein